MSHDPYPDERPDPYKADPYSTDPYVPGRSAGAIPPPAHEQPQMPPAPLLPGPGMPPPYAYLQPPQPNTSAIVLTVLAGLTVMTGYCCPIGVVPLILGVLGITNNSSDPEGAARLTKIGWIVFAALTLILLLAIVALIAAFAVTEA